MHLKSFKIKNQQYVCKHTETINERQENKTTSM